MAGQHSNAALAGFGVSGGGSVLGAGDRKLVLRLVRPDEDPEPLLELFEKAHQETRFNYIPFSREKARRLLATILAEEVRHILTVAELGGRPQGFVLASVGEYFVGAEVAIVTIDAVYTLGELRGTLLGGRTALGLFKVVARWAKGIKASEIILHVTSGIGTERTNRFATQLGFRTFGGSYVFKVE